VYLVKITDPAMPSEDKQVALVTALHGGRSERSGPVTILYFIGWLLGDADLAKETRQKRVVRLVPIANPYACFTRDRFTNKRKIDLYDPQISYWDLPKPNGPLWGDGGEWNRRVGWCHTRAPWGRSANAPKRPKGRTTNHKPVSLGATPVTWLVKDGG
jgi:hypothetical protein